jgi:GT2 family glycosyltransferase
MVTIGVLTRDARRYVERTIPALLAWTRRRYRILVLDNASTDGTLEYLRSVPEVRLIESRENTGYGNGKNALVAAARSPYVLLLDDDVLVEDERVVLDCAMFLDTHPDAAFVSVPLMEDGRSRTPHYGLFYSERKVNRSLEELRSRRFFAVGGFVGGLVMCRRHVWERLGGFDTIYPCQDYDLCARAYLDGWRIYTVTTAYALHLGVDRRSDGAGRLYWQEYELCGWLRTILKVYTVRGVMLWMPLASLWIFWKHLRRWGETGDARTLVAYWKSAARFFRDLRNTLAARARVQTARTVPLDTFRHIRFIGSEPLPPPSVKAAGFNG